MSQQEEKEKFWKLLDNVTIPGASRGLRAIILDHAASSGLFFKFLECEHILPPHYCELMDVPLDSTYRQIALILHDEYTELCNPHAERCPECNRGMHKYLNVGRNHFGVCLTCSVTWWIGSNLFSSWKEEDSVTWEVNKAYLKDRFRPVGPVPLGEF